MQFPGASIALVVWAEFRATPRTNMSTIRNQVPV